MPDPTQESQEETRGRLLDAQQRRTAARAAGDKAEAAWILAAFDCGRYHFELGGGDLPFAPRLFNEAIKLIEKRGHHRELLPELLGMTGRAVQRMKLWKEVLPWYRRAAEEAAAQGLAAQQLRWLGKEATTCLAMKQPEEGRKLLERTIEIGRGMLARGQPVAEILADHLRHLADLEGTKREKSDALWEEAGQLLATVPQGHAHFRAAVNRAGAYADRGEHWVAQTYLEEAIEIGATIGISGTERSQLVLRLARLLRQRNEPVQAGERLLAFLPECVDDRMRHEIMTGAMDAFFAGYAWEKMKSACEHLRELRREMRPGWRFDVEMKASVACRSLKQFDEALQRLHEATGFAHARGKEGLVQVRGQTAVILLDKGQFGESARLGEELWAEGVRNTIAARTLVPALIGLGQLDRAEAVVKEFEEADGDKLEVARQRAFLADAGRGGDPRKAWYTVGLAATRERAAQAEALTHLMALSPAGSKDRLEEALHRLRLMDYARMRVNDLFSDASWQAAFEGAEEFPGWLDEFVIEALATSEDNVAIYELERFRAQTLVALLAERQTLWSFDDVHRLVWLKSQATSKLQRARYQFEALTARGAGWRERRAAARKVQRLDTMSLSAKARIIAPAKQSINFPQELAGLLGDTQLVKGEALLFAHALPDCLAIWIKQADGQTDRKTLPGLGRSVVERLGSTLRRIGHTDDSVAVGTLLAELEILCGKPLAAWLADLGVRRAFLSAGTVVAALPLDCTEAFLTPEAPEIIMLPSGAALGFTRAVRKPLVEGMVTQEERDQFARERMDSARGRMLVVLDPSRDLEFAPLEAATIASTKVLKHLEVLDKAKLDPVSLARSCGEVDVLHFIGHGCFSDASPYRSGLTIGPLDAVDALWSNADIFSDVETAAGRLAVLSGCETGQTKPNLVSEEVSLFAAFIAAGFAVVVASRWAVDDLSTTLLMAEFHHRWGAGATSVAAALKASRCWLRDMTSDAARTLLAGLADSAAAALPKRAKDCRRLCARAQELLDQEGDHPFADPLYWAAFFVAGDGAVTRDGVDQRVPRQN